MSNHKDINLYSFTGDKNGNIWLNERILFWDKDWNGSRRSYKLDLRSATVGKEIADTVKLSGVIDFDLIIIGHLQGGYEDCIDINNECNRCSIWATNGMSAGGRYVVTAKGGSEDIYIEGVIMRHGKATDVALGEHSDQSMKRTREVTLNLLPFAKRKVDYWRFNANSPKFTEGSGPYNREIKIPGFFRKAFARLYAFLKKIGLPI